MIVVQMHGEPGSGKSMLARALGESMGAVVVDKDGIGAALMAEGQPFGSRRGPDSPRPETAATPGGARLRRPETAATPGARR